MLECTTEFSKKKNIPRDIPPCLALSNTISFHRKKKKKKYQTSKENMSLKTYF